jgi:hypothetical protein
MENSFDIFISYKHSKFINVSRYLYEFLCELNVKVWLDQVEIGLKNDLSAEEIAKSIEEAIRISKLIVFFETYDSQEYNYQTADHETRFNWQVFEQQFAKEVLIVHPSGNYIVSPVLSSFNHKLYFYNWPYLAYLLAITIGVETNQLEVFWGKYFSIFPSSTALAYHIYKFHALAAKIQLPRLIDPNDASFRRNFIRKMDLEGRKEISDNNEFVIDNDL